MDQPGGQNLIYGILDNRFPEETIQDRLGEILLGVFDLKVEKGEMIAGYFEKVRIVFSVVEAEEINSQIWYLDIC